MEIKLSAKADSILERYKQAFVTDDQLIKYRNLGAITKEEYDYIYETKHSVVESTTEEA